MPDAPSVFVRTERLVLRRFRETDLGPFVAMRADPEVARYQSWSDFTRADGEAFVARTLGGEPDLPGQWFQLAIDLDGVFAGDCAMHVLGDRPDEVELGVTLSASQQGRGIAREALSGLISWLFEARGKRAVVAVVDARNAPAIALFEALGFRESAREEVAFKGAPCTEITWRRER